MNYWSLKRDQFAQPFWEAVERVKQIVKHSPLTLPTPLLGLNLKEIIALGHKNIYMKMLTSRLFIIMKDCWGDRPSGGYLYKLQYREPCNARQQLGSTALQPREWQRRWGEGARHRVCVCVCINRNSLEIKCGMWEQRLQIFAWLVRRQGIRMRRGTDGGICLNWKSRASV